MRIALALLGAVLVVGFGCRRSAPTAVVAATPTIVTNAPSVQMRRAEFIENAGAASPFTNQIVWEFKFAEFKEETIERHGFKELFSGRGEKNALVGEEVERSPMVGLARGNTNINLTLRAGGYAGIISGAECSNLISYLEATPGIDVLTPAKVFNAGDRAAQIQVMNAMTVVVPGAGTNTGAITTTNLNFGITVNVRAFELTNNSLGVEVSSRMEEFGGYEGGGKAGGRANFDVTAVGSRTKMGRDEVLMIGSPMRMRVTRWRDAVPYLSDIPTLGRLFTKSGSNTNFYRVVMIARPMEK